MYDFIVTSACKKDFKKLDHEVHKFIRYSCFPVILENPFVGKKLKGDNLKGLLKYSAKFNSVDYRIVYRIKNNNVVIIFIMIQSRENFYKKLKNRIK